MVGPAHSARDTDSYDGNIYYLYAANGSLVPPPNTIAEGLAQKRTSVVVYYLDDSATSKAYAPVVSALKLIWGNSIDVLPLATDELQGKKTNDPRDPAYYWNGLIPQTVIIDGEGNIRFDQNGQVSIEDLNQAISDTTGLAQPSYSLSIKSFNEYNSEPSKE